MAFFKMKDTLVFTDTRQMVYSTIPSPVLYLNTSLIPYVSLPRITNLASIQLKAPTCLEVKLSVVIAVLLFVAIPELQEQAMYCVTMYVQTRRKLKSNAGSNPCEKKTLKSWS